MKVSIDYDVCASTGACMQTCPEVFEVRSDGFLYLLTEEPPEEALEGRDGRRHVPDSSNHRRRLTGVASPKTPSRRASAPRGCRACPWQLSITSAGTASGVAISISAVP